MSSNIHSEDIVRVEFDYAGSTHNLDLELFRSDAPLTVANYLSYVNGDDYDSSFIYRSLAGFIIQSGRYTFKPVDPVNDPLRPIDEGTGLELVVEGPLSPVVNEFKLSNIRGTIAMAKLPDLPDSATNEWFINLADNSKNLDNQNQGFTVFGSVIDDGMAIVDEISNFTNHQFINQLLGSDFDGMPLTSGEIFGVIVQPDMVMITSASVINRPIIRFDVPEGDFDLDIAGDAISELLTVTLINMGNEPLLIGTINTGDIAVPFGITDNCLGKTLLTQSADPNSVC
ncbi:MAG: peptidylprolyl isomerase, partial [Gammaproteobacteria bacterium]|nr:peptidylprolyl isomerase [Gammaproteobacteria bacterium]